MEAGIENKFAEGTFLLIDSGHDVIEMADGGIGLGVKRVRGDQLADGALALLYGSGDLIGAREDTSSGGYRRFRRAATCRAVPWPC